MAGGTVPGYLINQYALSEWHGNLRVASTSTDPAVADRPGHHRSPACTCWRRTAST